VQLQRDVPMTQLYHQRLQEMSDTTGGQYFQFNLSFAPVIERVENINSGYYLVTYRSPHTRGESGYQKVDVSVKNPEFRVIAREGYQFGG
jgi:hypothetical protein